MYTSPMPQWMCSLIDLEDTLKILHRKVEDSTETVFNRNVEKKVGKDGMLMRRLIHSRSGRWGDGSSAL